MTDAKESPQPEVSSLKKERLLFLAILLAIGGVAVYYFVRSHFPSTNAESRNVELEQQLANISEKLAELKSAEMYREDQQQAKKSRLQQAADRGKAVASTLDELSRQIEMWQKALAEVMNSDRGKALAANSSLLQQFASLQKQKRAAAELPSQLHTRLDLLLGPIEKALHAENMHYSPSDDLMSQLGGIETEASQAIDTYREHNQQLQAILAQLPATAPPGALSLQDALIGQEKSWAAERAQRLATELDKTRRENDEKAAAEEVENQRRIAQAERERQRRLAEAKAADIGSDTDKEVAAINTEAQRKKDAAEAEKQRKAKEEAEAQLEREFAADLPDIQAHLKPLFLAAYGQPIPGHMHRITQKKEPMSLTAIRSTNALKEGKEGIHSLWKTVVIDDERNKVGWPEPGGNSEFYIQAQNYLIKYGDLMVKKGLLSP